jgi:hypothetical protein
MKKIDKLIISHKGNLQSKYGSNFNRFLKALKKLQAGSKKNGLKTEIVFVDDAKTMKKYKAKPVASSTSASQFKAAVDSLYKFFTPDYVLLAGAQDIVPFQMIKNPAVKLDEETEVPSDLPYACEATYGTDAKKFVGPTRVVGRLPDVPNNNKPEYFETLVDAVLKWKSKEPEFYKDYFGLSTVSWKESTSKNIAKLFSDTKRLNYSPTKGPAFAKTILRSPAHFINCHGASEDPAFYGEKGEVQPESLFSKSLNDKITYGTVVAAECCFGAQMFDPAEAGQMSIANNYLYQQAIAFLGSSTIAYGPEDHIALADLITQYFISNIFEGASTGRALLEARIKFLQDCGPYLDVMELKTVNQFYLLGDPSVQPVKCNDEDGKTTAAWMNTRSNRRENLKKKGLGLEDTIVPPKKTSDKNVARSVKSQVKKMLKENRMDGELKQEVYVNADKRSVGKNGVGKVHYIAYAKTTKKGKIAKHKVLMVKERNSSVLGTRIYVSR